MIKYKLKKLRRRKIVLWAGVILIFSLSLGTIARFYASVTSAASFGNPTEIRGPLVTINDSVADWNYYMGLNYTEVDDRQQIANIGKKDPITNEVIEYQEPTIKYSEDNLVKVEINYSGVDINEESQADLDEEDSLVGKMIGYVSGTEPQYQYKYYKYYPIEDGYITIELIDNPWGKRPTGYGFNAWVCDTTIERTEGDFKLPCNNYQFTYDDKYYTRYLKVPAPTSGEKKLIIDLRTSWIKADITTTLGDIANFNPKGMQPVTNYTEIENIFNTDDKNVTGYFYKTDSFDNSGLYYDQLGKMCTTENTCNASDVYKLIQSTDSYSIIDTTSPEYNINNYYYLVTRDTNIFDISDNSISLADLVSNSPFTATTSHDYSIATQTIESGNLTTNAEFVLENVEIANGTTININSTQIGNHIYTGSGDYYTLYAEHNTKVGRNVKAEDVSKRYTLDSIVGGENIKFIVEAGFYNDLVMTPVRQTTGLNNYGVFGCDYDRARDDYENLKVYYQLISSTRNVHDSTDSSKPVTTMTVKSGTYGYGGLRSDDTNSIFYQYGIYAGTIGANEGYYTNSLRALYFQGGRAVNINGGPAVAESTTDVSIGIYMTGGKAENVIGGAGTARSYGARIVSITGGQVYNSVVAGSNSYNQERNYNNEVLNGPLSANTLAYIGGSATIGSLSETEKTVLDEAVAPKLFGVEKRGTVFGGGLGREGANGSGIVDNTIVIINGGTVTGDVYGGSNFGLVGQKISGAMSFVELKEGTIKGNVYGGSNYEGFGNKFSLGKITIDLLGSTIEGSIYGGSNHSGLVNGNIDINLMAGSVGNHEAEEPTPETVNPDFTGVYGGGYGSETYVNGNITIISNAQDDNDLHVHNIYGGSANGTVNTTGEEIVIAEPIDLKNVQVFELYATVSYGTYFYDYSAANGDFLKTGDIVQQTATGFYVYEEGKSTSINRYCRISTGCGIYVAQPFGAEPPDGLDVDKDYYIPYYTSATRATRMDPVDNSSFMTENQGNVNITINGGTITGSLFGGGLGEKILDSEDHYTPHIDGIISVVLNGGSVANAYAGNDQNGDLVNKYIPVEATTEEAAIAEATAAGKRIYKYPDGHTDSRVIDSQTEYSMYPSTLVVNGGSHGNIYGGGRNASIENTILEINDGTITDSVYGGSKRAGAAETIVNLNAGTIHNAFGGSNLSGEVTNATVNNKPGSTIDNSYGGGNYAKVINAVNNFTGATINNSAFTGGKHADVTNGTLYFDYGTATNVFGGCDQAGTVANARTYIKNGSFTNIYGGNNEGGKTSPNSLLQIDPTVCEIEGRTCSITTTDIYGGGYGSGAISYNTNTIINNVTVNGSIYGGGSYANTYGNVKLYLNDVTVAYDIYGGGKNAAVIGEEEIDELSNKPVMTGDYLPRIYINLLNNITAENVFGGGYYGYVGNSILDVNNEYLMANEYNGGPSGQAEIYLNLINATINNNVYGSGNASFAYSNTHVNIGDNAINNLQEQQDNITNITDYDIVGIDSYFASKYTNFTSSPSITIHGSVYGGSETNPAENTRYTDSYKGVIGNAYVNISTNNYKKANDEKDLKIYRSIYGGGNNSAISEGKSYVLINKLGTEQKPDEIISIQRASYAFIVDSYLYITGMQDRANASSTSYTLTRLDHLYLLSEKDPVTNNAMSNGSILYLKNGSTYLKEYNSGIAPINIETTSIDGAIGEKDRYVAFEPETVTQISEETKGISPNNVDNQIYMKNSAIASEVTYLAIANGEEPTIENTNAGSVYGMTYFGVFYNYYYDEINDTLSIKKSIYDHSLTNNSNYKEDHGNPGSNATTYAYVFGKHDEYSYMEQAHNHGFYSNFYDEETGILTVDYIYPQPDDNTYYRWELGERKVIIPLTIEANKYSQRTAVNVDLNVPELLGSSSEGGYWHDAYMTFKSFDISDFAFIPERTSTYADSPQKFEGFLVDRSEIKPINTEDNVVVDGIVDANNLFALSMGTTEAGWLNNYRTSFISGTTEDDRESKAFEPSGTSFKGDTEYYFDSSTNLRNVSFWLYYSQNLYLKWASKTVEEDDVKSIDMGIIKVETLFKQSRDDPSGVKIIFEINVKLTEGDSDYYGTSMAPGKKYDIFQNKEVAIPSDGSLSIYHKLAVKFPELPNGDADPTFTGEDNTKLGLNLPVSNVNGLYSSTEAEVTISGTSQWQQWDTPYRYLASSYKLPVGARISMIDLVYDKEYFYEVKSEDDGKDRYTDSYSPGIYKYYLDDFVDMGCTEVNGTTCNHFSDSMEGENSKYYFADANMAIEEFIFIIDLNGVAPENLEEVDENAEELPAFYTYLTMAHQYQINIGDNENHVYPTTDETKMEAAVVVPKGNPATDLLYRFTGDITSELQLNGGFYNNETKEKMEYDDTYDKTIIAPLNDNNYAKVYDDSNNLILRLETNLRQTYPYNNNELYEVTPVDTKFDDHNIGSKITIGKVKDNGDSTYDFEPYQDVQGLIVTLNGDEYQPYTDGILRIPLSLRTSSISAPLNFDFSNSKMSYGKYVISVETFMSVDGMSYDQNVASGNDVIVATRYFYFELLDTEYGLEIKADDEQLTHDANTGLDINGSKIINYEIDVKNGLSQPNLKVGLQRRLYDDVVPDSEVAIYQRQYEDINIYNLFENIELIAVDEDDNETTIASGPLTCFTEYIPDPNPPANEPDKTIPVCKNKYNISDISQSERDDGSMKIMKFILRAELKEGPSEADKANPAEAEWKTGTYRIVVYLYDKKVENGNETQSQIGNTYEYLIIRDLDFDGEGEPLPSPSTS